MEIDQLPEIEAPLSQEQIDLFRQLEAKKKAREIFIPTDDGQVRTLLRRLLQPITLFGEGPADRRDRLRAFAAQNSVALHRLTVEDVDEMDIDLDDEDQDEEFFTRGSAELEQARLFMLRFSLPRTQIRLEGQKVEQKSLGPPIEAKQRKRQRYGQLSQFDLYATQTAAERPLSTCAFSPSSKFVATGCFGGSVKVWSVPDCQLVTQLRGHQERTCGISWHPNPSQSPSSLNLASGSFDGSVQLWSLDSMTPLASLDGHVLRVASTAFHPSGRFLGTASYDYSASLGLGDTI